MSTLLHEVKPSLVMLGPPVYSEREATVERWEPVSKDLSFWLLSLS